MKYQFYAIIFDVAGNTTPVGSSASPAKSFVTNIQKVTGISINPSGSVTKNIGESFTISVSVSPSDANNKTINWNSTNTSVATVDSNGKVTCLSAGSTTITATAVDGSGISASLTLTVRNPLNSLTLDKDQTTILKDGYTSTVTATTDPANYDGANISWTIADTSIATVTVSGKTATIKSTSKIGQTTLTVSAGGITKTVNVSVVNFVTTTYEYTGSVQQVDLPAGTYKLEVWGAQGGSTSYKTGGYGGYTVGKLTLASNVTIFIYIGGRGGTPTAGFNGGGIGGSAYSIAGGGGASHIALKSGALSSLISYKSDIIIVAGGGGGGGQYENNNTSQNQGGHAGGFIGGSATPYNNSISVSTGGSQSSGGTGGSGVAGNGMSGSFGKGGDGFSAGGYSSAGGGGGYYGGGSGACGTNMGGGGGGGGSGYINTSKLTNAFMYGYNVSTSSANATKTYSTTNYSETPISNYAKAGHGAARITPVN